MFNDNWYLFILILLLLFSGDGNIDFTETAVLIGVVFALFVSNGANCNPSVA